MRFFLLAGILCSLAFAAVAQVRTYDSPPGSRGSYVPPYTSPPGYNASPYGSGSYDGNNNPNQPRYGNGFYSPRGAHVDPYRSPGSSPSGGPGGSGSMNPFSGTFGTR